MGTKTYNNYEDLLTFTRASKGHALRPVSYGDELVTNGTFDSDTNGWTAVFGTAQWASGELLLTEDGSDGTTARAYQTISTVVGNIYYVTASIGDVSNGSGIVAASNTTSIGGKPQKGSSGNETISFSFVAEATTTYIVLAVSGTSARTVYFDNISVKEVTFDQPDGTLTLFEHPNNIPRVEYDADGNRLGLLVEEARTNLVTDSNDVTVSLDRMEASETTGPDGSSDAQQWKAVKAEGPYLFPEASIANIGVDYSFSVFVRAPQSTPKIPLRYVKVISQTTINNSSSVFDLEGGTVISTTAISASITKMNDGWYRLQVTEDSKATGSNFSFIVYPATNSSGSSLIVDQSQLNSYVIETFGWQLEEASFPTSYIKTTGSTATRSADVASIPVADFGYNTAVGSIVAEVGAHNTDSNLAAHYTISKTSIGSEWVASYSLGTGVAFRVREGGSAQGDITISNDIRTSGAKTGFAFKEDDFAAVVNGGTVSTDTAGSMASGVEELKIAGFGSNPRQLCGHIKSIKYYPRRLTNAQLVDLTS